MKEHGQDQTFDWIMGRRVESDTNVASLQARVEIHRQICFLSEAHYRRSTPLLQCQNETTQCHVQHRSEQKAVHVRHSFGTNSLDIYSYLALPNVFPWENRAKLSAVSLWTILQQHQLTSRCF